MIVVAMLLFLLAASHPGPTYLPFMLACQVSFFFFLLDVCFFCQILFLSFSLPAACILIAGIIRPSYSCHPLTDCQFSSFYLPGLSLQQRDVSIYGCEEIFQTSNDRSQGRPRGEKILSQLRMRRSTNRDCRSIL